MICIFHSSVSGLNFLPFTLLRLHASQLTAIYSDLNAKARRDSSMLMQKVSIRFNSTDQQPTPKL